MVDKNTTEFSRESFKDKILRQLEEGAEQQGRPRETAKPDLFERPTHPSSDTEFTPYFDEEPVKPRYSQETGSLREKLAAMAVEKTPEAPAVQYSRSSRKSEPVEDVIVSEPKIATHPAKRNPKTATQKNNKKPARQPKKKATAGRIITVIVPILVLVAGGTGWYGYNYVKSGVQPLNPANHTIKAINIPAGSSSKQIGDLLQKQGIVKNGMIFQYYSKFKNYTDFKSGYYNLSPDMTLSAIASKLEEGGTEKPMAPTLGKVLIPEGYTLEQISKAVEINAQQKNGKTPFTAAAFMKVVQDPAFIAKMQQAYPKLFASLPAKADVKYQLEGYLFPATYDYTKTTTVESLAEQMIAAMDAQLEPFYDTISTQKLTVNEVLSLSALVEKEANNDDDRRNVAGTFFNRMAQNMNLGSNSAVLYAQGQLGEKTTLSQDATIDTSLNSPYNLYLNTGFGPGPIDSPSLSSIKAVLEPAQNDYLYFVADVTTGKVYFAKTLDEQNANVQTYVNDKLKK